MESLKLVLISNAALIVGAATKFVIAWFAARTKEMEKEGEGGVEA